MTWLNINTVNNHLATTNSNDTLIRLPKQFVWESEFITKIWSCTAVKRRTENDT